jgi:hypothetical protein
METATGISGLTGFAVRCAWLSECEDLERDLQALVTDSTLRQAEPVVSHSA